MASFVGTVRFMGFDYVKDVHKALSVHAGATGIPWALLLFASIQLNQGLKLSLVSPGWDIFVILGMHVCTVQVRLYYMVISSSKISSYSFLTT